MQFLKRLLKSDSGIVVPPINASKYVVGTYISKLKTLLPTEIQGIWEMLFCRDKAFEFP